MMIGQNMSHRKLRKNDFASRKEASFLINSIVSLYQLGYFTVNLNSLSMANFRMMYLTKDLT